MICVNIYIYVRIYHGCIYHVSQKNGWYVCTYIRQYIDTNDANSLNTWKVCWVFWRLTNKIGISWCQPAENLSQSSQIIGHVVHVETQGWKGHPNCPKHSFTSILLRLNIPSNNPLCHHSPHDTSMSPCLLIKSVKSNEIHPYPHVSVKSTRFLQRQIIPRGQLRGSTWCFAPAHPKPRRTWHWRSASALGLWRCVTMGDTMSFSHFNGENGDELSTVKTQNANVPNAGGVIVVFGSGSLPIPFLLLAERIHCVTEGFSTIFQSLLGPL